MTVPSQWPYNPSGPTIAFVGEAPSDEEMSEGQVLVGPSGRVMSQLLRTANLGLGDDTPIPRDFYPELASRGLRPLLWSRSPFFWTNVFDTQLPDNDVKGWCAPATEATKWDGYGLDRIAGAGFLRPEFLHHLSRLRDELEALRPDIIIPLGGTALWAFTGDNDIMARRGAVAVAKYIVPGTKLLPTLHPAHVIHSNFRLFSTVVGDLQKAWREAQFREVRLPKREIWVEPTLDDLWEFKKKYIDSSPLVSVDIETAGGAITCIGFASSEERAICVPFVDYRKPNRSYWPTAEQELEALNFVASICEDPNIPLLMQNGGSYDIYWLWRYWGIKVNNYAHDTRLMSHALWPELPKSLQFMASTQGDNFAWKQMREKKSGDGRDK